MYMNHDCFTNQRWSSFVDGEATMLRVYMYQERYNGLIDLSRYGLNLEDLDHVLTRSVDTRHDE